MFLKHCLFIFFIRCNYMYIWAWIFFLFYQTAIIPFMYVNLDQLWKDVCCSWKFLKPSVMKYAWQSFAVKLLKWKCFWLVIVILWFVFLLSKHCWSNAWWLLIQIHPMQIELNHVIRFQKFYPLFVLSPLNVNALHS